MYVYTAFLVPLTPVCLIGPQIVRHRSSLRDMLAEMQVVLRANCPLLLVDTNLVGRQILLKTTVRNFTEIHSEALTRRRKG